MNLSHLQQYIGELGIPMDLQSRILKSLIAVAVLYIIKLCINRIALRRVKGDELSYRWQKISAYLFYILTFIIVGGIWYSGIHSLATFLGLASAGLAIAFKDYLSNLAGWLYLFWKEPFKVGHRIQIGDSIGDVIDIGTGHISLLEVGNFVNSEQSTGRILFLPNSKIFTELIANYDLSFPYIWHEIDIVLTFESNWKKAKEIVNSTVKSNSLVYDDKKLKHFKLKSKQFLLPDVTLEPIVFTSVADQGVRLSARFVCEPRNRRSIEQAVWEQILDNFSQDSQIDFAYPTQRFFDNLKEGKQGYIKPDQQKPLENQPPRS